MFKGGSRGDFESQRIPPQYLQQRRNMNHVFTKIYRNILTEMHEAALHISSVTVSAGSRSLPRERSLSSFGRLGPAQGLTE